MFCMAEGCTEEATVKIRPDGPAVVCEKHENGAGGWIADRKQRIERAARAIFAQRVVSPEHESGTSVVRAETLADLAIDEATVLVDRVDARFR